MIVPVYHQEVLGAREGLRGKNRVGRSQWLFLHRELNREPLGPHRQVVLAHGSMFGRHHQADLPDTRLGQTVQHVIQEGPIAQGHHGLGARSSRRALLGVEFAVGSSTAHARTRARGEHHGPS